MSDMYLTKVERKTIFTHGLIYVLFTFVISDLTVVGPHIFVIFPWIYILGILGVNKFYHPLLTLLLSCVTTFMASLFKYNLGMETLTSTLVSTSIVGFGIITGLCIKDFVLEHRLVKYLSVKKRMLNIFLITFLTVASIFLYSYQYGNVIGYVKSKQNVASISKEMDQSYEVLKYQYVLGTFDEYVYKVKVLDSEVTLNVKDNAEIANLGEWKSYLDNRLNEAVSKNAVFVQSNLEPKLNYEFKKDSIKPSSITAVISIKEQSVASIVDAQSVAEYIRQILAYVDEFEIGIDKCILTTGESIQTLKKEEFASITADYLMESIKTENLEAN